jgi:hypothetical protein
MPRGRTLVPMMRFVNWRESSWDLNNFARMNYVLTYSLFIVEMLSGRLPRVESTLHPVDLRCEYLKSPLGIDRTSPRLSWKLQAALHGERGLRQTAFQFLVAATVGSLGAGNGDLWDSGRVVSDQSTSVVCAGRPLESRQQCWWKVRIWDQDGQLSEWSEPSMWSMGLLHAPSSDSRPYVCQGSLDSPQGRIDSSWHPQKGSIPLGHRGSAKRYGDAVRANGGDGSSYREWRRPQEKAHLRVTCRRT